MLHGHGADGDVKCCFTLARTVTMAGRGGRGGGGEAMGEMDWLVVRHGRRPSTTEERGDGNGGAARLWRARAREKESERVNEHVIARVTECLPLWYSRMGQHQHTATTRHAWPALVGHNVAHDARFRPSNGPSWSLINS